MDHENELMMQSANVIEEEPVMSVSQLFRLQESRGRDSFLVDTLIPHGSLISVSGEPKSGKSVLINYLAVCVALGKPWLGKDVTQGPVLWYAFEESLEERAQILKRFNGVEDLPIMTVMARAPVNRDAGFNILQRRVQELGPKLVVIDPLVAAFGDVDFNDQSQTRRALQGLKVLCDQEGIVLILIHHLRKDASSGPLDRNRTAGSAQIMATCSADWILKGDIKDKTATLKIRVTGRLIGHKELVVKSTSVTDFRLIKEGADAASTRVDTNLAKLKTLVRKESPKVFSRKELMDTHGFLGGTVDRNMRDIAKEPGFHRELRKGVWFDGKSEDLYDPFEDDS